MLRESSNPPTTSVTHDSRSRRIRSTPPERVAELTAQELQAPWSCTSTTPASTSARTSTRSPPSACTAGRMRSMIPCSLLRRSARSASLSSVSVSGTPPILPWPGACCDRKGVRASGEPDGDGRRTLHHRVGQLPDPLDLDAHHVAVGQEARRVETGAHTGRRARGYDRAGLQRNGRGQVLDEGGTGEDQIGRRGVLPQVIV